MLTGINVGNREYVTLQLTSPKGCACNFEPGRRSLVLLAFVAPSQVVINCDMYLILWTIARCVVLNYITLGYLPYLKPAWTWDGPYTLAWDLMFEKMTCLRFCRGTKPHLFPLLGEAHS